jgi:hypothetical protein
MESELFPSGGTTGELLEVLKFMEGHAMALQGTQVAAYGTCRRLDMREGNKLYKPYLDAFDDLRKYLSPTGVYMDIITKKFAVDKEHKEPERKKGLFGFGG